MGRVLARIFAVLAVGAGVGLLTWGISATYTGEPLRMPEFCEDMFLQTSSEVIGWGAGILAVGITTLFLTFVGRMPPNEWDE